VQYTQEILETARHQPHFDPETLSRCIEACSVCGHACTACADACLGEGAVAEIAKCIRLNLDCADVCEVTARVLLRHFAIDLKSAQTLIEACAIACRSCGDECERHWEHMEHCRLCAEACRLCEQACNDLLSAVA
jgi:hypothetical protein